MTRLIDADALKRRIIHKLAISDALYMLPGEKAIYEEIEKSPTIDAVPVKHGIWMEENPRPRSSQFYCSVCHRTAYDPQPTRIDGWVKRCRYAYCPNCGAIMDERGES